jgi:hypothetical protein
MQLTISTLFSITVGNLPDDLTPHEVDELASRMAGGIQYPDELLTEAMEDLDLAGDPEVTNETHGEVITVTADDSPANTPVAITFPNGFDTVALRVQKGKLIALAGANNELDGLIHMIDHMQDELAKTLGDDAVFGKTPES